MLFSYLTSYLKRREASMKAISVLAVELSSRHVAIHFSKAITRRYYEQDRICFFVLTFVSFPRTCAIHVGNIRHVGNGSSTAKIRSKCASFTRFVDNNCAGGE